MKNRRILAIILLLIITGLTFFFILKSPQRGPNKNSLFNRNFQEQSRLLLATDLPIAKNRILNIPTQVTSPQKNLISILEANDFCALTEEASLKFTASEILDAIFRSPSKIASDPEADRTAEFILTRILNPEAVDPDVGVDTNHVIEFYRALAYGGLIEPPEAFARFINYDQAGHILSALESNTPSNGAFPIFRAAVLMKAGATKESVRPLLLKGMRAESFNTYHTYLWQRVLQRALRDSSHWKLGQSAVHEARVINYEILNTVRSFVSSGESEFVNLAIPFAKKLLPAIPPGGRFEFYTWSALEYVHAKLIERAAERVIDPKKDFPPIKKPGELLTFLNDPEWKELNSVIGHPPDCGKNAAEKYVKRDESLYLRYMNLYH